jgi:hypothetical protein
MGEYKEKSNAELTLLLNSMKDEYASLKHTIRSQLFRMEELDKEYSKVEKILITRTKGKI